jgi:hypothetical protein
MKQDGFMVRLWVSKWARRTALVVGLVCLGTILTTCWYLDIRSARDVRAYLGMRKECHPVWKDLALRRIYAGQPTDELLRAYSPQLVRRSGNSLILIYQNGDWPVLSYTTVEIWSENGCLIAAVAGSCTWEHVFFDNRDERDIAR